MDVSIGPIPFFQYPALRPSHHHTVENLHVCPHIDVAAGHRRRAEEYMPAVAACSVDPDRVLAAVRGRAVETDFPALIAVRRVDGPERLVPSILEVVRDLGVGEG